MLEFAVALVHHDQRHLYNRIPWSHNRSLHLHWILHKHLINYLLVCHLSLIIIMKFNTEEQSCKSGENSRCGADVTNVDFVSVKVEVWSQRVVGVLCRSSWGLWRLEWKIHLADDHAQRCRLNESQVVGSYKSYIIHSSHIIPRSFNTGTHPW